MEKKDERARIPAGTFASSEPPEPAADERATPVPAPEDHDPDRFQFEHTLVDGAGLAHASPPMTAEFDRRRYTNTLVGHGGNAANEPHHANAVAPVLAPPKWRGAKAYLEGQEPKPRVSSIPTPPPVLANAGPGGIPSKVTTRLGPPPPPPPSSNRPEPPGNGQDDPEIDVAIERMLEAQTSVPMEVESAEAVGAAALDELEELTLEEAGARLDEPASSASQAGERAQPAPANTASERDEGNERERAATGAAASAEPQQPASEPDAEPAATGSEPQAAATESKAESPAEATPARESGAAEGAQEGPKQAGPKQAGPKQAPAASPSSSLAPTERAAPTAPRRLEPRTRFGLLMLAAMVGLGLGGWLLTRGGFNRARLAMTPPAPLVETSAAQAPAQPPSPPQHALMSMPRGPMPPPAEPTGDSEHHGRHPSDRHATHGDSSSASHRGVARHEAPEPAREEREDDRADQPPVLRVTPRGASTPSETPTRQEVLDALEPLRGAVERCANGQHGVAQLDITVVNSGVVTHAVVGGDFSGTPEGSCIALAARRARFAPFQKPRFRVIFPFSL